VSLARRLGFIAAVAAAVLLLASAGLYWLADRVAAGAQERGVRPGWFDTLRAQGRRLDVAGLALERTNAGDGAALVYDTVPWGPAPAGLTTLYGGVTRHRPLGAADSALWRRLAVEPGLERVVTLARMREWRATARATAADSTWIWGMRPPALRPERDALEALILRAYWRAGHRDPEGARADLGAVFAIGDLQSRREPGVAGAVAGLQWVREAARACAELADRDAESARAARCRGLSDAGPRPEVARFGALHARPDTAALVAADTSLLLAWRAEALEALALRSLLRPRGILFGIPRAHAAALDPFVGDRDPDVARLALVTRRTAERLGRLSFGQRLRAMADASVPAPRR
jgi:hypothetical protein